MANKSKYNPSQFCRWDDARALAAMINADPNPIGDGVAPETDSSSTSGIYLATWLDPGDMPPPEYTDDETGDTYYPLLFRFNNGKSGFNVSLTIHTAKGHAAPSDEGKPPSPPNWKYALDSLRAEVDAATV